MALNLFGQKPAPPAGPAAAAGDILEVTDATFMKEVLEESRTRPVIIDFWAPWCGPCRQLTPVIEKVVASKKGAVRLAKINIDENPAIAQQFRVQSIPAVFVVDQGKAFQGFTGALPESQIKSFIDELVAAVPPGAPTGGPPGALGAEPPEIAVADILQLATEALAEGDAAMAGQAYAQVLQLEPDNLKALAGLARCHLSLGQPERAQAVLDMAPPDAKDSDLAGVRAALQLAAEPTGDEPPLRARLAADPNDHQARYDLAAARAAKGDLAEAVDLLLDLMARDRAWNDDGARKQLLTLFEAAGWGSEVAKNGRKRLSSLLFA